MVAYDALTYAGNRPNLADVEDRISFVHGDVCDGDLALETLRGPRHRHRSSTSRPSPTTAWPCSTRAGSSAPTCSGPRPCSRPPATPGVARFHHISTCEVYGDLPLDSDDAFTEDHPYRPRTPYNASKAGADHAVRAYVETYGLPATITNCSNNYGPYQFPEKVIPLFAAHALDDRPLPLYESTRNQREWLHVVDHCRAIEAVLERGRIGETYHVGSGVEASIEEIADAVLETLGKPQSLKKIVPDRPGHDRRYLLDCTKITKELGWAPTIGFEEGLADTVRWYADNRAWWEPLMDRAPVVESSWGERLPGTSLPGATRSR